MKTILFVLVLLLIVSGANAQERYYNTPLSQYYRYQYFWNPAYAGAAPYKAEVYAAIHREWIGFDDAPQHVQFAGDVSVGNNSGFGLQLLCDKSGVLTSEAGIFSYAYKIQLFETIAQQNLRLGIDIAFYRERIDNNASNASGQLDPYVKIFNGRGDVLTGNFGAVYENKNLSVGGTIYNLRAILEGWNANLYNTDPFCKFQTDYKFELKGRKDISIAPLVAYELSMSNENLFTFATQFEYNGLFNTSIYYQTNGNVMGGLGIGLKNVGEVNFLYSGNNKYSYNEQWEVGLKMLIGGK